MGVSAWFGGAVGTDIENALVTAGVTRSERSGGGPGVLLLDPSTPMAEAVAAVTRLSDGGRTRMLVLSSPGHEPAADDAWRLLHAGAADVVGWQPGRADAIVARLTRWAEVDALLDSPAVAGRLIGRSRSWRAVLRRVVEVARYTVAPVLLIGESGTGKELLARLVHELDPRPDRGSLVIVDCTTVVPTLSGSEFFGHERGAFTGASVARDGAFALANGGTLFLDEVGELPLELQSELLRVVQEGTFKRVGSNRWQPTRFRLVCATNRDLVAEQAAGRFRRDFYYRIAATTLRLPALRDRPGDTLPLAEHFLAELNPDGPAPGLDPLVRDLLLHRDYPGNVRDLRQLTHRLSSRHVGPGPITAGDVPEEERPLSVPGEQDGTDLDEVVNRALRTGMGLRELREAVADAAVRVALDEAGGNVRQAAARLGVTERALQLRRAGWRDARAALSAVPD
ncbi:sigma 54-interacting transcriptional regulator [Actinoplanes sp. NPDC020271]|uniref:sigma 54-interacting transcriptional regulator n=1 Tax=Actinoplanes sp. NPDC020271 TaxID=3363896 RepID=UPI003799FF22